MRDSRPNDTTILDPLPAPAAAGPAAEPRSDTSAAGPDQVSDAERGERFLFEFSTGERVSVTGTGLLGRHPVAGRGELVDQLITIADPERSVSKTHLEFGQEAGELWICDRYSANGTLIVPVAGDARPCEPGRRYQVQRGSRVAIAGQFFTVS
ncbi:MAG: FHA domain-containing protein [Microbacteriaceae bacterium]